MVGVVGGGAARIVVRGVYADNGATFVNTGGLGGTGGAGGINTNSAGSSGKDGGNGANGETGRIVIETV